MHLRRGFERRLGHGRFGRNHQHHHRRDRRNRDPLDHFWWLYQRATKEIAFVRTGQGGQKVVVNGGAFVIPVLHDTIRVNMSTVRIEISRTQKNSIITRDRMRVDVTSEF